MLARTLAVSDFGLFKYLLTMASIYAIAFAGFPTALTKFIGEDKSDRARVSGYFSSSLAISFAAFLILSIIIVIFSNNAISLVLLLFAVLIDTIYLGLVRGLLNYVKLAGFKLVENIAQLTILLFIYLVFHELSLNLAIVLYSLSGLVSLMIFESVRTEITLKLQVSILKIRELVHYAIPVSLGAIGWIIMLGTNTIVIEQFYGTDQVGFYSVGLTLAQVFSLLPESISTILMPKAAGIKDRSKVLKYVWKAVWASVALSAICLLPLLYFKSKIVTAIFTDKYIAAVGVVLPLSLAQVFISTHQIIAAAWQGLGCPGVPSITISIAAALNIVGSLLLTSRYGIAGAAVSIALSSFVAMVLITIWLWTWSGANSLDTITVAKPARPDSGDI
jgi:O-antigen/teichoic acid export membrane protein